MLEPIVFITFIEMATSNRCSVDQKDLGPVHCTGCDKYFCTKHFRIHQNEMFSEMDKIIQDRDRLQDLINKESQSNDQQHPIIEKINQWRDHTIKMVKQVAAQACQQAIDLLNAKRVKLSTEFKSVTKELVELKESENYVEHDLKRLNDMIKKFKQDLEQTKQPTTIILHTEQADKINWDTLMYVEEKKRNSKLINCIS